MRLIHSHDPDHTPLSDDDLKAAISLAHQCMWEYAEMGEFVLAHVYEARVDRLLLALHERLSKNEGQAA